MNKCYLCAGPSLQPLCPGCLAGLADPIGGADYLRAFRVTPGHKCVCGFMWRQRQQEEAPRVCPCCKRKLGSEGKVRLRRVPLESPLASPPPAP